MKYSIVILIGLAWLVLIPSAKGHSEKAPHGESATSSEQSKASLTPPPVIVHTIPATQPRKQDTDSKKSDSAQNPHNWLEWINAGSTTVIAIFAILTTVAIWFQVKTARNSERAWITVTVKDDREAGVIIEKLLHVKVINVECILTNCGKTPARLTSFGAKGEILEDSIVKTAEINYKEFASPIDKMLLAPKDSISKPTQINIGTTHLSEGTPYALHVYGIVNYLDAFNKAHFTRFYYVCSGIPSDPHVSQLFFERYDHQSYSKAT